MSIRVVKFRDERLISRFLLISVESQLVTRLETGQVYKSLSVERLIVKQRELV